MEDPKNITKKSEWWLKESSGKRKWLPPDELLQTWRTKSQNIFKKYDLQHKCKSDGEEFNRKRNFLFYDYRFYSILDTNKKIVLVADTQGNINWIRTCDNDISSSANNTFVDIRSLLIELSSFLTYFQKGISYLSQNYKHLKDEGKLDKELFAFEFAVIPNHKREATDRASSMESLPTREAITDLDNSERRFLTKSRNSSIFLGKANLNPCFKCNQTRSIGFDSGE
jgi:hypothetical protein